MEFKNALRIYPDFAMAHSNLGLVFLNKGLWDDAIAEFRKAIKLNPEIAEAHYNLGIALNKKGLTKDAIKAYEGFIKYAPESYKNYVDGVKGVVAHMKKIKNQ